MSHNISKTELEKFSLFSICSKKFGYGHYNRIQNLISLLRDKNKNFNHYSYGVNLKNKNQFLNKLNQEIILDNKIVLDITNDQFLDYKTISKIKKILGKNKRGKIYILDSPIKKNLSTILNLDYIKTIIPFEVDNEVKKKLARIKIKRFGLEYFIYPINNLKKNNKIYDIMLSFGGSDNYQGTIYAMKLLENLKIKKKVVVVNGKYFKSKYKKKIFLLCKKNKFKNRPFSKNFKDMLSKSKLLITNSGLTKYEGVAHKIPVIVFSDNKELQKIDKIFTKRTKQLHMSYKKKEQVDSLKLQNILQTKFKFKFIDKKIKLSNVNKIRNFFQ